MKSLSIATSATLMASASAFAYHSNPQHPKVVNTNLSATMDKATQEWDVDRYQDQHSFVWKYGESLVDLIDFEKDDNLSILDIGCGSGELTRQLAGRDGVGTAVGMDLDRSMIDKATAQAKDEDIANVSFQVGDIRSFSTSKPFDVIFSNAALHWIPPQDMERAVQHIAESLKPGGQLVLEMGGKGNVQSMVEATQQVIPTSKSPWCFPSVGEMSSLLEKYDVEVLSAQLFDRPTALEDGKEGVKNWLRMFGAAFFQGMNKEEIEDALVKINEEMLAAHPEFFDGENWTSDYRRLRIVARKKQRD